MDDSSEYLMDSSEFGQDGGNTKSEAIMITACVCACTVCILSIIMIFIINEGRHCKNRGGKKP